MLEGWMIYMENMETKKTDGIFKDFIDTILGEEELLKKRIILLHEIKEKCTNLENDYITFEKQIDESVNSQISKLDEVLKTVDATSEEDSVYKDIISLKNKIIDQANIKKIRKKSEITVFLEGLYKESGVVPEKKEEKDEEQKQSKISSIEIFDDEENSSVVENELKIDNSQTEIIDVSPEKTLKDFVKINNILLTSNIRQALDNQYDIWHVPIGIIMESFGITDQRDIESIITNNDNMPKLGMIGFRYNENRFGVTAFNGKAYRGYGGKDTLGVSRSNFAG